MQYTHYLAFAGAVIGVLLALLIFIFAQHSATQSEKNSKLFDDLLSAIATGNLAAAKTAIAKGADVNGKDETGATPLMFATESGDTNLAAFLLEQGARRDTTYPSDGSTPLILAAQRGFEDLVKLLATKETLNMVSDNASGNISALSIAAQNGHTGIVKILVEMGAKIHNSGTQEAALRQAAQNGHFSIVEYLVQKGADVNVHDAERRTPLHMAALGGHTKIVHYLLQHGAEKDAVSDKGAIPLMYAVQNGHADTVKLLITKQNVNMKTNEKAGKTTALMHAAQGGYLDVVTLLVEHGAQLDVTGIVPTSDDGKTDPTEIFFPLLQASLNGHTAVVKYLLEHGAPVNQKNARGQTALMAAQAAGKAEIEKLLLERGAK